MASYDGWMWGPSKKNLGLEIASIWGTNATRHARSFDAEYILRGVKIL